MAIFLGMLLACLDEFHQFYSLNRGPGLKDVLLDTMGVITGVMLAFGGIQIINLFKKGKKGYDKLQKNNSRKNCKSS